MLKLQDRPVALRYARALFGAAQAREAVEPVRSELAALADVLRRVPAFGSALGLPRLPSRVKLELLEKALGSLSPLTRVFFALLLEKNRWNAVGDIVAAYGRLADEKARVTRVRAEAPVALEEAQQNTIRRRLEKAWGGTVVLEAVTDPSLLGGLVLRAGDRVWDNSLRGQLDRLRDRLVDATV